MVQDSLDAILIFITSHEIDTHQNDTASSTLNISVWDADSCNLVQALRKLFSIGLKEKTIAKIGLIFDRKKDPDPLHGKISLWPFLKQISDKSMANFVENLKEQHQFFKNSKGKEFGWIIASLNDGFLFQHIHSIRENQQILLLNMLLF
jgi:hypothetical protein